MRSQPIREVPAFLIARCSSLSIAGKSKRSIGATARAPKVVPAVGSGLAIVAAQHARNPPVFEFSSCSLSVGISSDIQLQGSLSDERYRYLQVGLWNVIGRWQSQLLDCSWMTGNTEVIAGQKSACRKFHQIGNHKRPLHAATWTPTCHPSPSKAARRAA